MLMQCRDDNVHCAKSTKNRKTQQTNLLTKHKKQCYLKNICKRRAKVYWKNTLDKR